MKYLNYILLVFAVIAILAEIFHWSPVIIFFTAALGVVPLAGFMGKATEELAVYTGPKLGGLLNATLGNAAELIISIVAIQGGLLELVLASITGSILGNLLLILGFSVLLGGFKFGIQTFDRRQATVNSTMLILALIALAVPSLFNYSIDQVNHAGVEYLSLGASVVMLVVYALSIVFSFKIADTSDELVESHEHHQPEWSLRTAVIVLVAATVGIAYLSEVLVGAVEPVVEELGVTEFFLGIILIPLVGNVAEHVVAIQMALKNKMELSLAISLGSSLQVALFVAPLLVFISLALGNPLTLTFNVFELIALFAASLIAALIALDGESNWLEGVQLLGVYLIIGIGFFFLP
ncbi:MAG: calcium/proton exchanger [Anaerolineae bacterium]|nr:calcium/proton exchanger [Anaerolineales bacterium]MCQ3971946.1 calcium/proton exchanger [Anaerolineae bacterium]